MKRIAITGAAGFVGRQVARALRNAGFAGELVQFDRTCGGAAENDIVPVDLTGPGAIEEVAHGAGCVIHLAALPGAAAETDPLGSRVVNLRVPLDLIESMNGRRLVLASSIAVFGGDLPRLVTDDTPAFPRSVYGTHKRMTELAFADAVRRRALQGCCLRLPGIVARPVGAAGFGSAFLSEVFHAAKDGQRYTVPVAPDATSWLMSVRVCAENIVHAALGDFTPPAALNLPCLNVAMGELVNALSNAGFSGDFDYREDANLRRLFGSYPDMITPAADDLGFKSDASIMNLVENVMADV